MALQDSLEQLKSVDFNDLDLSNIGSWPAIVKIILMVLLFAVVLGGGYYLHVTEKQESLDTVTAAEVSLKKQYKDKAA